jgi:hypothetical protein
MPASNAAIGPPTVLKGTRLAELLDGLDGGAETALELVTLFLLQTPLCVIVDTLKCLVHNPASKKLTELTETYHWMYSRKMCIKNLEFWQRTWTDVTRDCMVFWV